MCADLVCCVNIECPCSVNNLVADVRMTRRPILHPSRHGWLPAAAAEIRLELAIIARLLAKHNSQPSLLDGMRMCTEIHRYTELYRATELSRELYSAVKSYRAIQIATDLQSYPKSFIDIL